MFQYGCIVIGMLFLVLGYLDRIIVFNDWRLLFLFVKFLIWLRCELVIFLIYFVCWICVIFLVSLEGCFL